MRFRHGKCLEDRWQEVGGRHQIDIVGALVLQAEHHPAEAGGRDSFSQIFLADVVVLAEAAPQGTAGEENGPAASRPADAGLLPVVEGGPGCCGRVQLAAVAGGHGAVGAAVPGAEMAGRAGEGEGVAAGRARVGSGEMRAGGHYTSSLMSPSLIQPIFRRISPRMGVRMAGITKQMSRMPAHIRAPPSGMAV